MLVNKLQCSYAGFKLISFFMKAVVTRLHSVTHTWSYQAIAEVHPSAIVLVAIDLSLTDSRKDFESCQSKTFNYIEFFQ